MLVVNSLSALQSPSFGSLIAESVPEEQQGTAFGLFEFCVGLGVAIGPALGAFLLRAVDMSTLMVGTGVVALICAIIRAMALRETAVQPTSPHSAETRSVLDTRLRWFLVAACVFYTAMAFTVHGPFISLHAKDVIHLSESQINWLFAVGSLMATMMSLAGGRLVDRVGSRLVLVVSSLGHYATLILWAFVPSLGEGLPVFMLSWSLMQTSFIAYSTTLAQNTSAESRTTVMGLFGTTIGIASTVAPALGSLLRERLNSVAPFWAALALGLLTALVMTRVKPNASQEICDA
jgi:predicted MFS family arabinose efflux permease